MIIKILRPIASLRPGADDVYITDRPAYVLSVELALIIYIS